MGRIYRPIQLRNGDTRIDVVAFVDYGADKTIISERVARHLELAPVRKDKVIVANGEFITTYVDKVRIISTRDGIDTIMYVDIVNGAKFDKKSGFAA